MTTQPPTDAAREVTQKDREAAASWAKSNSRHAQAANIRRGSCDDAPIVQAFARHRLAVPTGVEEAVRGITDDYMTSEAHHPGYVLIPVAKFEQLRAAETTLSGGRAETLKSATADDTPHLQAVMPETLAVPTGVGREEVALSGRWQPIATVDKVNGRRLILAWDDCPSLSYHWEVGRWSRELGWVNTYGKAFGASEPTHWMDPLSPQDSALLSHAEAGGVEGNDKPLRREVAAVINEMGRMMPHATEDWRVRLTEALA